MPGRMALAYVAKVAREDDATIRRTCKLPGVRKGSHLLAQTRRSTQGAHG
jgi:hypothetical protein